MILQTAEQNALHLMQDWAKGEADLLSAADTSVNIFNLFPSWVGYSELYQIVGRELGFCILTSTSHWLLAAPLKRV